MALKKLISIRTTLFKTQCAREFSQITLQCEEIIGLPNQKRLNWDEAVNDAIQLTKYESPFPNLRYMTTNKHVNWLSNLEKMEQIDHPLRDTAR